jgi:hypothetical protein
MCKLPKVNVKVGAKNKKGVLIAPGAACAATRTDGDAFVRKLIAATRHWISAAMGPTLVLVYLSKRRARLFCC